MIEKITFREAILKSMEEALDTNINSIILGQGVTDPTRIFGTTKNLVEKYGKKRIIDMPICEEGMTGFAVGASLGGLYPIQTHIRMDFLLVAMNQIANTITKYNYMYGGMFQVPMLIRAIVGRSWGQGPQHSQSLQSIFAHFPGLQVIMPATAADVINAYSFATNNYKGPVLSIEHRLLYDFSFSSTISKDPFSSYIIKKGRDITIVATSIMVEESIKAANWIEERSDIRVEIINVLNVSNINYECIFQSLTKTRRLIVADTGWTRFGLTSEIISAVSQSSKIDLKSKPSSIGMTFSPCPTSHSLEDHFYPNMGDIVNNVYSQIYGHSHTFEIPSLEYCKKLGKKFKGPF